MKILIATSLLVALLSIAGCKSAQESTPAYELAQQCITVKNSASGEYLAATGDQAYQLSDNEQAAEKFFLKPSGLGTFLLYDREQRFLGAHLFHTVSAANASKKTEWRINKLALYAGGKQIDEKYTLVSINHNRRLLQGKSGLIVSDTGDNIPADKAAFDLIPQPLETCTAFPEAALDAEISDNFYAPQNPDNPVRGFVDIHTHLGFPKSMAALAMAGNLFHPYGIEHALHDCADLHGKDGKQDLLESEGSGETGHATAGYPDFPYWPRRDTSTHVQAYYRWLQRGYLSGLRLMVTNVTGNPTACQLLSLQKPGKKEGDCSSESEVENQTRYIYDLQDYIDAQEGGPGKGWFRIVTSPQKAREVINQNKLAVVLGSEYGTLFDCAESAPFCTAHYIDQQLEKLHALGVRSVFPIHRFDNAFGGTRPAGGASGAFMHLSSKLSTGDAPNLLDMFNPSEYLFKPINGHYWQLETCPEGVEGTRNILSMEQFVNTDFRNLTVGLEDIPVFGSTANKVLDFAVFDKLEPLPDYAEFSPEDSVCNSIALRPMGHHLINRLIDKGMIVDVDHMGYYTLLDTLDIFEQRQYSGIVSSHGWTENSEAIRKRIFRLGGQLSPSNHRPSENAEHMKLYQQEMRSFPYAVGVGIGSDIQGVTTQPDADPEVVIRYPFDSIDGLVTFTPPKTGNRHFNYKTEGMANYGLLAEWVENMRQVDQQDTEDLIEILMNSAEAYLQMWERAQAAAVE